MQTVTSEKKTRRTKEEIVALVDKAEKLIANGMPKTKAAEEVGIAYQVLQKHLGEGVKNVSGGDNVDIAYHRFKEALTRQIRREIAKEVAR